MNYKIDRNLIKAYCADNEERCVECIVYMNDMYLLKKRYRDIEIIREYPFIKAVGIRIKVRDMLILSKDDNVKYISSQNIVKTQIEESKKILNIDRFYAENIYGQGIRVAIIDTGIEPMLDFVVPKNRIILFKDFVNGKESAYDDNGHGTFVSGVLLGNGLVSNGKYSGVAPFSELIAIKALDKSGEASTFKVLDAMQWVYDNKGKYNIKVVCMSFGSEPLERNDPLSAGVEALWRSGIVVVVAGGNSGPKQGTIKSPGINPKAITVGGAETYEYNNFEVPAFSSRGPVKGFFKPDIVAPAVDIISNNNAIVDGKGYTRMSGTSVATPMIAGVCALLCQKFPNIRPEQVKSYILKHGKSMGYGRNVEGFGLFLA
ncbi:MAG: S8 family peptidase [Clostridia bacterium]|nr:S8 family peptidase [Clostridia bacterium]